MQRAAQPEEMAPTYVFLASPADLSYVTGEVVALMGEDHGPTSERLTTQAV